MLSFLIRIRIFVCSMLAQKFTAKVETPTTVTISIRNSPFAAVNRGTKLHPFEGHSAGGGMSQRHRGASVYRWLQPAIGG